jgi:hypothetical protein
MKTSYNFIYPLFTKQKQDRPVMRTKTTVVHAPLKMGTAVKHGDVHELVGKLMDNLTMTSINAPAQQIIISKALVSLQAFEMKCFLHMWFSPAKTFS